MDRKQENKERQKEQKYQDDFDDSQSDMEEEEELDLTKRKQDIDNEEQIQPSVQYGEGEQQQQQQQMQQEGELEEEEGKQEDFDMVNVDLNFYDPCEKQFHSIKTLVNGYLDGLSFNSSDLSDIIVKQVQVGTMVGIDDPDEQEQQNIFGFTTTLQLSAHKDQKVFQEIAQFVSEKSLKHNSKHDDLIKILDNPQLNIGLLINERILNCSPFIVPTLHNQFLEDLTWVKEDDPEEGSKFNFDYLLVLSKIYKPVKKQEKAQKKKKVNSELDEYVYQKFEDYKFLQRADQFFMFEAENTKSGGGVTNHGQDIKNQICYRTVYLLKWNEYTQAVPLLPQELIPIHELQQQQQMQQE